MQPHDPEEFDDNQSTAASSIILQASLLQSGRAGRILRKISSFLLGQGAVQALNLLIGLVLVRCLSVEAYAQFGIANGFQSVFSTLMDLGFAGTIIPLVGSQNQDLAVVGRYVRAARSLRGRVFLLLTPVTVVSFIFMIHKHHWTWTLQALLLASILLSLYSGGNVAFFSAPLFLAGKLRAYYVPQAISSVARLLASLCLFFVGGLNAWTAAGLGAIAVTVNGALIRNAARRYLAWPRKDDPAAEKQLIRYVLPATPAIIFSAFQLQISLFLVSLFGSTLYMAEVTALSRVGQIFLLLSTFSTIAIEPYVARLPRPRLLETFITLPLLAAALLAPFVLVAFRWPGVFLLLLGPKFKGLHPLMGWYVLSAAMNSVSGLVWIMNRSRKWVFWSGSALEVILLLTVQCLFLIMVGVRDTRQAVFFMLASSCCYAVAHGYVTLRGFQQKPSPADGLLQPTL